MKFYIKNKITRLAKNESEEKFLEGEGFAEVEYEVYLKVKGIEIPGEDNKKTAKSK